MEQRNLFLESWKFPILLQSPFKTMLFLPFGEYFFLEIRVLLFIYLFIYDCVESSFLCEGFL